MLKVNIPINESLGFTVSQPLIKELTHPEGDEPVLQETLQSLLALICLYTHQLPDLFDFFIIPFLD